MNAQNKFRKLLLIIAGIGLFVISAGFPGCEDQSDEPNISALSKQENTQPAQQPASASVPATASSPAAVTQTPAATASGLDFTVTDIQGNKIKLSDYRGKNVMVIFWATWCPPCKVEMPDLIELRKKYTQDQLVMLAISEEPAQTVKSFVAANKNMNYTIATTSGYASLPAPLNKAEQGAVDPGFPIPKTFYIDRTGQIRFKTIGITSLKDIIAYLEKLN